MNKEEEYIAIKLGDIKDSGIFKIKESSLKGRGSSNRHLNSEDLYMVVRHEASGASKYLVNLTKGFLNSSNEWGYLYEVQILR